MQCEAYWKNQTLKKIASASCKKNAATTIIARSFPSTRVLRFEATNMPESTPATSIMIQRKASIGTTNKN